MEFDEGKDKTQNDNNAKSAHFITSYFRTPAALPIISAIIKTTTAKTIPATPYVLLVSFQHRRTSNPKINKSIT